MSKMLLNKVAVITGSTDGIGYAIAERFLKEGAKVMIGSRKQKNVDYALSKLGALVGDDNVAGAVCHVGSSADRQNLISRTVEKFGNIDVVVSNAGTNIHLGPSLECTEETWDKMINTNVKSSFFFVKEAIPKMNKNGSVIINSSIGGYNPFPNLGIYCITKTALLGMIKVLSQELGATHGIRVNGIAPGIIKTKFSRGLHETPEIIDSLMSQLHLKRLGSVDDCAGVAVFLASDNAAYVTGETIVVSGGLCSRL